MWVIHRFDRHCGNQVMVQDDFMECPRLFESAFVANKYARLSKFQEATVKSYRSHTTCKTEPR